MKAKIATYAIVVVTATLLGCSPSSEVRDEAGRTEPRSDPGAEITIVHPDWSSEIASARLFQAVLQERLGFVVNLRQTTPRGMWEAVANGQADFMTGAWLPETHREYLQEYGDQLIDYGAHLSGARLGLVVPASLPGRQTNASGSTGRDLVSTRTIPELLENTRRFEGRILGIGAGAGVMARTRDAIEIYGLSPSFRLIESDESSMLDRVNQAVFREHWVVFTGWTPHWMFERYNLRFLDDPQGVYGGEERIHTMARRGFSDDYPDAATVVDRISYRPEDLERLMRWIQEDDANDPYRQALRWLSVHQDLVDQWVSGI